MLNICCKTARSLRWNFRFFVHHIDVVISVDDLSDYYERRIGPGDTEGTASMEKGIWNRDCCSPSRGCLHAGRVTRRPG